MVDALVTPELIRWARERYNLTADKAAHKVSVSVSKFTAWEKGDARPTLRQAQSLAQKLNVPFGYLFLSAPPSEKLPLPDLRTVAGAPPRAPSPEFLDALNDVLRKQQWYREYQESEEAQPIPFIGRFSLSGSADTIATDIRSTLGINDDMRQESSNWEQFLREFIRRAEGVGILVLRSSIVENNTHRKLNVEEFRGFAISDDLAPLVFINAQDAKAAQIFTLAHELAHLWVGESGISNPNYMQRSSEQQNSIERLCDRVAAETLVSNEDFLLYWQENATVGNNLQTLAARYRVSAFVILRRAYENNKLSLEEYRDNYLELVTKQRGRGTQSGGDFYATLLTRNSNVLTLTLLAATAEGRVLHRDAARLLNVKMKTLTSIGDRLLAGRLSNA